MKSVVEQAKKFLAENPNITPAEMFRKLHGTGYNIVRTVFAVFTILMPTLDTLCKLAIAEYKQPLATKQELQEALTACEFAGADIDAAIAAAYPVDTARYSAIFTSGTSTHPAAPLCTAYQIGCGDFTVEAWIKPTAGGGTIISRKGTDGGHGNGGFLLVLKPDGVIKLATDDGLGFYEINSAPVAVYDGAYHHILGLRRGKDMEVHVDFKKIQAEPRTDRFPGLDINNRLGMALGHVEQQQEPYNAFNGFIGEVRIWNIATTYPSKIAWASTDYLSNGLIAMWGFWNQSGEDYSLIANSLNTTKLQFETWSL